MFHYLIFNFEDFFSLIFSNILLKNIFFGMVGAIMGSFATMLIYRLPVILKESFEYSCNIFLNQKISKKIQKTNIITPSKCVNCGYKIPFRYNIPILGYILTKGYCNHCHKKISIRYFLIEMYFIVSFLIVANLNINILQSSFILLFVYLLTIISIIDYNEKLIINELVYILMFLGFLFPNYYSIELIPFNSVVIFILNYMFLKFICFIMEILLKKDFVLGEGDILLISVLCEYIFINYIFIFYILIGTIGVIYFLIKKQSTIALAPTISLAFLVVNILIK